MVNRGIHVVFEGPEAVGKSTQIQKTKDWLEEQGFNVVLTREPGGTEIGLKLRQLLLETDYDFDYRAEALLMAADRAQNVSEVIHPNLSKGNVVISDRHVPSSLVYQGVVRGLGVEEIKAINDFACGFHTPDLILCFDLDDDLAKSRASDKPDRIESEGEEFHQRIRDAYRELTETFSWSRVDANGSQDEVFMRISDLISAKL